MKRVLLLMLITAVLAFASGARTPNLNVQPAASHPVPQAASGSYSLMAWSELGMPCIDGKDYSIFSVLPPYNVIHAQLIQKGEPPVLTDRTTR